MEHKNLKDILKEANSSIQSINPNEAMDLIDNIDEQINLNNEINEALSNPINNISGINHMVLPSFNVVAISMVLPP